MAEAIRFRDGVNALETHLRSYFEDRGVEAFVGVDFAAAAARHDNQGAPLGASRVLILMTEDGGRIAAAHGPGPRKTDDGAATWRALANYEEALLVSIWAVDASDPRDARKQREAVATLRDWVVRGLACFPGTRTQAVLAAVRRVAVPAEARFGLEIQLAITVKQPIPDEEEPLVYPTLALGRGVFPPPDDEVTP